MIPLGEVLKAVGPNAAIIFASWIFMGFLQQRYDAVVNRFQSAIGDYRSNDHSPARGDNLKQQILAFRHRIHLMAQATLCGLIAAILLILTLILAAFEVLIPKVPVIATVGNITTIGGFAMIIVAAAIVMREARITKNQFNDELRDVPDLAEEAGQRQGGVHS